MSNPRHPEPRVGGRLSSLFASAVWPCARRRGPSGSRAARRPPRIAPAERAALEADTSIRTAIATALAAAARAAGRRAMSAGRGRPAATCCLVGIGLAVNARRRRGPCRKKGKKKKRPPPPPARRARPDRAPARHRGAAGRARWRWMRPRFGARRRGLGLRLRHKASTPLARPGECESGHPPIRKERAMSTSEDYQAKAAEALVQLGEAKTEAERMRLKRAHGAYLRLASHGAEGAARAALRPPPKIAPRRKPGTGLFRYEMAGDSQPRSRNFASFS